MRGAVSFIFCCLAVGRVVAQLPGEMVTARSESGQFVAYAPRGTVESAAISSVRAAQGGFILNPNFRAPSADEVSLDPALLVISCEKIKQALLTMLGERDQWRGRIDLEIRPSPSGGQAPYLSARLAADGWNYQLALPSPIDSKTLVRAVSKALLVEMANRERGTDTLEVPVWLIGGVSAQAQSSSLTSLVLQDQVSVDADGVRHLGMIPVRSQLHGRPALSFQQLSWPDADKLSGKEADFYCVCSQIFLEELLRFPDGRHCLREMIRLLPQHLNWQASFLQAFSPHFVQLLDVEKWWDLACVSVTQVDDASRFDPGDSWVRFEDALVVPVEVRQDADQMPGQSVVTLQEVISTWDPARAAPVIQRALQSLAVLRLKSAPEFAGLLDGYLSTLRAWMNDTRPDSPAWNAKNHVAQLAALRSWTSKDLSDLDARRALIQRGVNSPAPLARTGAPARSLGVSGAVSPIHQTPQP